MIATMRRSLEWYPLQVVVLAVGPWVVLWLLVMGTQSVEAASALFALGVVVVPVSVVALSSSSASAAAWALGRGARFSESRNQLLWHHLTRTRVARTLGFTLGIALPLMLSGLHNAGGEAVGWWPDASTTLSGYWLAGSGYVAGSLWAEVRKPRPLLDQGSGAALLAPRRLGDYLDPNVARSLGLFGMYAASIAAAWAIVPLPTSSFAVDPEWFGVVMPMMVVLVALGGSVWVSRRRERAADDASLAYEELTRTATVNALVGASIAMLGEFAAAVASLPREGKQIAFWLQLVPMLVGLLGLGIWIGCGTKLVFRNRRIDALRAAA